MDEHRHGDEKYASAADAGPGPRPAKALDLEQPLTGIAAVDTWKQRQAAARNDASVTVLPRGGLQVAVPTSSGEALRLVVDREGFVDYHPDEGSRDIAQSQYGWEEGTRGQRRKGMRAIIAGFADETAGPAGDERVSLADFLATSGLDVSQPHGAMLCALASSPGLVSSARAYVAGVAGELAAHGASAVSDQELEAAAMVGHVVPFADSVLAQIAPHRGANMLAEPVVTGSSGNWEVHLYDPREGVLTFSARNGTAAIVDPTPPERAFGNRDDFPAHSMGPVLQQLRSYAESAGLSVDLSDVAAIAQRNGADADLASLDPQVQRQLTTGSPRERVPVLLNAPDPERLLQCLHDMLAADLAQLPSIGLTSRTKAWLTRRALDAARTVTMYRQAAHALAHAGISLSADTPRSGRA